MDRERYARIHAIFDEARKLAPGDASRFLAGACAGDTTLREEVESLLEFSAADGDAFSDRAIGAARDGLERVVANLTGTGMEEDGEDSLSLTGPEGGDDEAVVVSVPGDGAPGAPGPGPSAPRMVGPYKIIRRIGSGGMGTVYERPQERPERRVAVKTIRRRSVSEVTLARFRQEAEILGRLQHPGIAQIFEFGIDQSRRRPVPYFAMEFVHGRSLTKHASAEELDVRGRLTLLARVCDAVAHAHEKGVVHRDLKPDNILVDASGQPKVLDFGVARSAELIGNSRLTMTGAGQLIGTLAYMAPEQARGGGGGKEGTDEVTAASDVYALGAIAFELLIGRPPHDLAGLSLTSALRVLTQEPAPRIGALDPALRGDIETIVGKALEMEPRRRYANAAELAADIRRFLDDRPIVARPAGRIYRGRKFVRRHRTLVGGALATFLALCLGLGVAITLGLEERHQRRLAQEREAQARFNAVKAAGGLVNAAFIGRDPARPWGAVKQLLSVPQEMVGWEARYVAGRLPWVLHGTGVGGSAFFEPGGRMVSTVDLGGAGATWDVDDPWSARVLKPGEFKGSPSAAGPAVGAVLGEKQAGVVDLATRAIRWSVEVPFLVNDAVCSTDGSALAVRPGDGLAIACYSNGKETFRENGQHEDAVFSDDGRFLSVWSAENGLLLIEARTGKVVHRQPPSPGVSARNRISPDGGVYYIATSTGPLTAIDTRTMEARWRAEGVYAGMAPIRISPDGSLMGVIGPDDTVRIVEAASGNVVRSIRGGPMPVVAFSRDHEVVGTKPGLGAFMAWRVHTGGSGAAEGPIASFGQAWSGRWPWFDFSPNDRSVVLSSPVGDLPWVVDLAHPWQDEPAYIELRGHTEWIYQVAVSHDGTMIASAAPLDPTVRIRNALTGEQIAGLTRGCDTTGFEAFLAFSSDDSTLVMTSHRAGTAYVERDAGVIAWDLATGRPTYDWGAGPAYPYDDVLIDRVAAHLGDARGARLNARTQISPLGATVARGGWTGGSMIKSVPGEREMSKLMPKVSGVAFHPSGRYLACGETGRIHILDLNKTGLNRTDGAAPLRTFSLATPAEVYCVAYSPDGSRLAAGCADGSVTIFETEFYQPMLDLPPHKGGKYSYVYALDWTPDGTRLVTASGDKTLRIWDSMAPMARRRQVAAIDEARPGMRTRLAGLNSQLGDATLAASALLKEPSLSEEDRIAARFAVVESWASNGAPPKPVP